MRHGLGSNALQSIAFRLRAVIKAISARKGLAVPMYPWKRGWDLAGGGHADLTAFIVAQMGVFLAAETGVSDPGTAIRSQRGRVSAR